LDVKVRLGVNSPDAYTQIMSLLSLDRKWEY